MDNLYYIIYVSYTNFEWDDKALKQLASTAKKRNEENDITGILLYGKNKFIQILEGPQFDVVLLFEKIKKDIRHKKISMIVEGSLEKRNFTDWQMGFKKSHHEQTEKTIGLSSVDDLIASITSKHLAMGFLKMFYEKNY